MKNIKYLFEKKKIFSASEHTGVRDVASAELQFIMTIVYEILFIKPIDGFGRRRYMYVYINSE